jgi:SAM-dependent methyltransferase
MKKQVNEGHYKFNEYIDKRRWASMWHQIDEVLQLNPQSILEVGPGPGVFKALANAFGFNVKTLDLDKDLNPDYLASATNIPLNDDQFDICCAFQMLEHLPFDVSKEAFSEMVRISKEFIIISLPDAKKIWPYSFYIPKVGQKFLHIRKPFDFTKPHIFDGQHYWEVNTKGYELKIVVNEFLKTANNVELLKTYRVDEHPYHRFFVFKKLPAKISC